MLEVPDWGLASWSAFGYGHWSLIHPWSEFWLSILILKVQRTSMSFKSSSGALEDAGDSWLGFAILIFQMFLTGVWHLDLDLDMVTGLWYTLDPKFGSLSWFWGCKEHPCPLSPDFELWRTLEVPAWGLASWSWFWYGHSLWYTDILNFGSQSLIWRCKEHPCPLSSDLGFWRMLEVPDWGLASWP